MISRRWKRFCISQFSITKERLILLFVAICIILLFEPDFFPSIWNERRISFSIDFFKYGRNKSNNIGFTAFEYEEALLQETAINNQYDLTAIMLHWQRFEGLEKTLHQLLYTNLFKQIIVWNNNPDVNLTFHHFKNYTHSQMRLVRIINSQRNLRDEAKYQACAEAKTRACFYIDDDYTPAHYLKSLIASFRAEPNLLHAAIDPYTYYINLVWSYFDSTIDLHTGFTWIGCGSVFLRQHAQHHLELMHKYLANRTDLIELADVFFSVWLNRMPVQMVTVRRQQQVSPETQRVVPFSATGDFFVLQYTGTVMAIRILEQSLRFNQSTIDQVTFSRHQTHRFPSYVKSPSLNDDLIFYTSILLFDSENVPFNISRDFERATFRNLPKGPNISRAVDYITLKAVDGDLKTCWHTHREIKSNDFFAIDFLSIQSTVMFTIAVGHSPVLQSSLQVEISLDGVLWSTYESRNGIYMKTNRAAEQRINTYLVDSSEFSVRFRAFRYISFKVTRDWSHRFEVCEVEIIPKERAANVKLDFEK